MKPLSRIPALVAVLVSSPLAALSAQFDAAPFGLPLPEGHGILWEDPREIHQVTVHFEGPAPAPESVRLEYWGSRWPEQRLPKDREPGGGDVGWMELGNWYEGGWRVADVESTGEGSTINFAFPPVNAKEFPKLKDYPAPFRYTLKLRVSSTSTSPLPKVKYFEAFTDSTFKSVAVRLAWAKPPRSRPFVTVFNGHLNAVDALSARGYRLSLQATANTDPNTFDRTLVTVQTGTDTFTFAADDLAKGPLFLPSSGVAILPENDRREYAAVASEQRARRARTLYDCVSAMPEQTWRDAWNSIPRKKSRIYFPLGPDGGRQRFLLQADGMLRFRLNDHFLRAQPGRETPRFELEPAPVQFRFGALGEPVTRNIEEESIPICRTTWEQNGVRIEQTALVTQLDGTKADHGVPDADALTVFLGRFIFTNISTTPQTATLPLAYSAAQTSKPLTTGTDGFLMSGDRVRGQVIADAPCSSEKETLTWSATLQPRQSKTVLVKIPYVLLTETAEREALGRLDFDKEHAAVASYWRRRLNQSAELITPEPVLNQFYRADAGHLLINCEREPNSTRRFARVGSFSYGAYGNESCMMVVDLDRRGYHREAQECLEAWLHYQGTVGLPGDFDSKEGVLYGAGGYESGGYNQHHGWILWMLGEHYRFTRDREWLQRAAPGILAAAGWINRQTARTSSRHELERGLLPAGSLEDIGDWWTWLSTSCYTWRGLDSAAWALEQINHPEAKRIRSQADAFHVSLLDNFRKASQRSPIVRLRDGTCVPKIPSQVHRRGRSFGWICETLEGSLHLLITRALDPHAPEAEWIVKDYEDNLYLSNQYGYTLDDFDRYWFGRGGMSMQACLLLDVEPYLYRDDVRQALRAMFNAIAVSHFPDVHMNTEHALPHMDDWRGDHYKSSDESNACGWLRYLFVREDGDELLVGQAVPRDWLRPGQKCGIQRAATYFGPMSVLFTGGENQITARLESPERNPPKTIQLRFRTPDGRPLKGVTVNGRPWSRLKGDWVQLPGTIGPATVVARYAK